MNTKNGLRKNLGFIKYIILKILKIRWVEIYYPIICLLFFRYTYNYDNSIDYDPNIDNVNVNYLDIDYTIGLNIEDSICNTSSNIKH